jgi:PAS domain-containing protein
MTHPLHRSLSSGKGVSQDRFQDIAETADPATAQAADCPDRPPNSVLDIERTRAEAALRESEEKYRSLFESIDQGFCLFERNRYLQRGVQFKITPQAVSRGCSGA